MKLPGPILPRRTDKPSKQDIANSLGLESVYRMSYNESILGPSPNAVAAIQKAASTLGDYPQFTDAALCNELAEVWGRGLTPDHFFSGCSGYETIELIFRAFLRQEDEVIVCNPTFGMYERVASLQGAKVVDVPLVLPDFAVDVDGILAAVTEQTRMLMLCNPNNPTGTVMPSAEMDRLVANMPDHVLIVSDEVYIQFVEASADFPDTIGYILDNRNVIMTHSFSKAYGLAGLRLGYAIAPPTIANYIAGMHRGFHQNGLALAGGVAALRDQAHVAANVAATREGKQFLYAGCDRLGLSYIPSQTNFFVLRMPGHLVADEVVKTLLADGVMVRSLSGRGLENSLRVSIGPMVANEIFIKRIEQILL